MEKIKDLFSIIAGNWLPIIGTIGVATIVITTKRFYSRLRLKLYKLRLDKAFPEQVEKAVAYRLQKNFENIVSSNLDNAWLVSSALSTWAKAMLLPSAQDLERAIKKAEDARERDPTNGDAYIVLGMAYSLRANSEKMQEGDSLKAMECLNEAIDLSRKSYAAEAYLYRSIEYINLGRESIVAIADYKNAIELNPNIHFRPYQIRIIALMFEDTGRLFYRNDELDNAIEYYGKSIELNPNSAIVYYYRGNVYKLKTKPISLDIFISIDMEFSEVTMGVKPNQMELFVNSHDGNIDKAIGDFTSALGRGYSFANVYCDRGIMYGRKGDYINAIKDFDKALELKPYSVRTYKARGFVYSCKGEYGNAIKDYDEVLKIKPDSIETYHERGFMYFYKGEPDNAIKDFYEVLKVNKNFAGIHYACGLAYTSNIEYENAIKHFNEALKLHPSYANAYHFRGFVYFCKNEYKNAIKDYNEALKFNPNSAYPYRSRGNAYQKIRKYDNAISDYEKALKLMPNFFEVYSDLAVTYFCIGHLGLAITNCNLVLAHKPDSIFDKGLLGLAYACSGNYDQAVMEFQEILLNPRMSIVALNKIILLKPDVIIKLFEIIISRIPNLAMASYGCGIAYRTLKDKRKADYYMNQSIEIDPSLKELVI